MLHPGNRSGSRFPSFFCARPPDEGRLRRGRSGVRNGSEAPSGRAAKGPEGTRKSTGEKSPRAERAAAGAETGAMLHPGNRTGGPVPFIFLCPPCAETDKPFRRNAAPRSEKTAGNPAKGLSAVVVSVYQASAREGSEALNELRRYRCDPRRRGRSRAPGTGQDAGQGTESKGAPAACRGGAVTARPARQPSVALRGRFRPRWSPDCPTLRWSGRRRESHRRGL